MKTHSGWQQPPVPITRTKPACPHIGLITAASTLGQHREGHEWVCACGQRYVVVSDGGREKRLVKRAS